MQLVLHNQMYHDGPVEVRERAIFAPEPRHALRGRMRAIGPVVTIFFCRCESPGKEK